MAEEMRLELNSRIEDLGNQITSRYDTLNMEVLWLFVATLGCWSVDHSLIRSLAIFLVFVLFSSKIFKNKKTYKTFSAISQGIRSDIADSDLEGDSEEARFYQLGKIEKNLLGFKSIYKHTPTFLLGFAFWGISLFYFMLEPFSSLSR